MVDPKQFNVSSLPPQTGKTILITGGTAGIGAETVQQLASLGAARIIFTGRNERAAAATLARVQASHPSVAVEFAPLDLASLADVARAAATLLPRLARLDTLILNAGIMALPAATSVDGYERHFAVNHMGHALLTLRLLPLLRAAPAPRVVFVSSQAQAIHFSVGIDLDTIKTPQGSGFFHDWYKYGQSKLANVAFARALAAREPAVTTVSIHPGVIAENTLNSQLDWRYRWFVFVTTFWRQVSPSQGGMNTTWAAAAPSSEVRSGLYYEPIGVETAADAKARDDDFVTTLWDWTTKELQPFL